MGYNSVDTKSIDVGLWTLRNINKIRAGIKIFLVFFTIVVYTFFIINLVNFIQGGLDRSSLYDNIFKNDNLNNIDQSLKNIAPEDLYKKEIGATVGYNSKYYDFYALVENKNTNYYIDSIEYSFKYNNGELETDIKKDYMGINSEKFLFVKGVEVPSGRVDSPSLEIKSINWKLIEKGAKKKETVATIIPRNCSLFDIKKQVAIKNKKVTRSVDPETGAEIKSLTFSVKNVFLYDLKTINNKIIYYNSNKEVIGIFEKEIYQLRSGGEKLVNILISTNVQELADVDVVPEVNFCSEDSYIKGL